jgi:hypothetical protein
LTSTESEILKHGVSNKIFSAFALEIESDDEISLATDDRFLDECVHSAAGNVLISQPSKEVRGVVSDGISDGIKITSDEVAIAFCALNLPQLEAAVLDNLVLDGNDFAMAAFYIYQVDQDLNEFRDTLKRVRIKR